MARRCAKPEHQDPPLRLADGRCRYCVRAANRQYKQRATAAYRILRQQVEQADKP